MSTKTLVSLLAATALAVPAIATAALADEQALAERYSPVVRLVAQDEECGPGEPYEPMDVDALFGQPTVALRGPWNAADLVKIGPTAKDLSRGLYQYHLDFPGNALEPGCDYERWARRLTEEPQADGVRARRQRSVAPGQACAAVLALLRLQRLEQPPRRRLGDDPARLRREERAAKHSQRDR